MTTLINQKIIAEQITAIYRFLALLFKKDAAVRYI